MASTDSSGYPSPFPPPWADAWGDDRYGLWAALEVKGVAQRLRWIAPGSFLMGSLKDEPGRQSNEGPQHPVTLRYGYWLADTACTQALWQAVMGTNPSFVTDDLDKPVEQVSWDDVKGFCDALVAQGFLPADCEACLPTEAQWEYACRAGSTTAYSFGDQISTDWCNHDYDRKVMERVIAKQTTLPVKAIATNSWGLYQMHGNVWEWCTDGLRTYTADAVSDPEGSKDKGGKEALFAVRGGSWFLSAQGTRSALRASFERRKRSNFLGFRFALRSK